MSSASEAAQLLDLSDLEEIERDLRRQRSVAGSVSVNPPAEVEPKRERKRRISIPVDDVGPAPAALVESSWLPLLYPVDLNALVDEAFTLERLARVPIPAGMDHDEDIEVDIDFEEVPSVERQEATSGVIGAPNVPEPPAPPAQDQTASAQPTAEAAPDATATPPPMPADAAASPPAPPQPEDPPAVPSAAPAEASGPPPVPLSAFTGESEPAPQAVAEEPAEVVGSPPPVPGVGGEEVAPEVVEEDTEEVAEEDTKEVAEEDTKEVAEEDTKEVAGGDAESAMEPAMESVAEPPMEPAVAPPPVPDDVIEHVSADEVDEEGFAAEGSTSVDEVKTLEFPDQGTPPPIPLEAATPILAGEGAGGAGEAVGGDVAEDVAEDVTEDVAEDAVEDAIEGEEAPSGAPPPPTPAAAEAAPPAPPQIPGDAKAGPPPPPVAAPPAVPAGPPAVPAVPAAPAAPAVPAVAKKKRPKKFKKPWFEEFFDDDYLRTIPFMTPTYTAKEMQYIRKHLDVPAGAKLLDVGCGYGRLAIDFAREGFDVTGLDTSLPLMFRAAEASNEAGVEVNFMHRDMREMSFDEEFDGVYCVMTSFGYFDDETNRDVVTRMHRALKPGGKLFIEVINRDFILNDLPSRVWWEGDDCVVMDEVEFNFLTSRIVSKRSVVFADGRSVNHDLSIRAYCLHELGRMLHNSGFRVVSVTGNINTNNRFFGQHSPYLIVLSEKPK